MRFLERFKKDLQSLHQLGTSALPVISSLPKLKNYVTVSYELAGDLGNYGDPGAGEVQRSVDLNG